jgi:LuxR family maltose regulon positive regulatory protein
MLEGQNDREAVEATTRGFAGTHQRIQEYVVSEFLSELPAPVQRFVLETSVLTRLTASLCAALTGRANSAELLAAMDRGNVLLEPLDNTGLWYRYHSLFAGAMQEEARRRLGTGTLRELSRRASRWYADHQMPAEAIEASLAAEDMEQAARLILSICNIESLLIGSHLLPQVPGFHTLRRWLEALPEPIFAAYPALWPIQAMALMFVFLLDMMRPTDAVQAQIEDCLDKAERAFRAAGHRAGLGEVFAFRSMLRRQRGDFAVAAQYAHEALGLLPADDRAARAISYNAIGFLEVHSGHLVAAEQALRAAQALCERLGNHAFVRANMGMLSWALYEHGKLHESATLLRRMLVEARAQGDLDDVARAQQLLGTISYQWNDLDSAQSQIAESLQVAASFAHADEALMAAELVQAQIEAARGVAGAGLARCARLIARLEHYTDPAQYQMYRRARTMQARLHLVAGDLAAVQHWAADRAQIWTEIPVGDQAREGRIWIRLLLATDQAAAALPLLEAALDTAHATGHTQAARETQVLLALAHSALKHLPEARQTLHTTLVAAYPEGDIRLFVDEGEPLAALLRNLLPTLDDKPLVAYARAILRAFTAADSRAPAADLSEQERRVLRLLAAGRSNPEIAGDLVVSINTVKAHVKNIYRKLDVTNRLEAGAAAQRLGLA